MYIRDCTQFGRSFIKIRNNKGPRTVPWGTPLMTGTVSDEWISIQINAAHSMWHDLKHQYAKSRMRDCTQYGRSFIKIRNNKGHRTVPWGTPLMTGTVSDVAPSTITCCVRLLRNALINPCVESTLIFQKSLDEGNIPNDWRTVNVTAIFKKGERYKASNYRPKLLKNRGW
jgi:hypothetical protein